MEIKPSHAIMDKGAFVYGKEFKCFVSHSPSSYKKKKKEKKWWE